MINALGFPGDGLDAALRRLERLPRTDARILVSVARAGRARGGGLPLALGAGRGRVEINVSSPNTAGLRRFHDPDALRGLLGALNAVRRKPLFVKIPPYKTDDEEERERVLRLVRVCREGTRLRRRTRFPSRTPAWRRGAAA